MPTPSDHVFASADRYAVLQPAVRSENLIRTGRRLPPAPVFSRAEARAAGWSDSAISRAVRAGRLVSPRRGFLARPDADPTAAVRAAVLDCRGAVASHRSALQLHGLPIVGRTPSLPQLTVHPRTTGSLGRANLHRATLPLTEVTVRVGVPVTSVARTLVDVARSCPFTTALAATDAALHRGLVSLDELESVVIRCWNWPRIRRVHRVLEFADGRAESPLESVSRLVLHWLRLPPPELQPLVLDEEGVPRARLDFYWDDVGVAGEADGRSKYDDRSVLTREKERQESVEDLGVTFARWTWSDTVRPHLLRGRVERAFERGRARSRSGLPRGWSVQPARAVGRSENVIAG